MVKCTFRYNYIHIFRGNTYSHQSSPSPQQVVIIEFLKCEVHFCIKRHFLLLGTALQLTFTAKWMKKVKLSDGVFPTFVAN